MLCMLLGVLFLLCLRLVFISVGNGSAYETMAIKQQKRSRDIKSVRGEICDRNGRSFTDADDEQMTLTPEGNPKKGTGGAYDFKVKKRFPLIARHLIGYMSENGGVCGIEGLYDDILKTDESISIEYISDAIGRPIEEYRLKNPSDKNLPSVRLTLDYDIQSIAEEAMDKYIKKGAAVIVDVSSFDVMAMVSRPDYSDDKIEESLKSNDGELLNRAVLSYNAGSVFKIICSAMALEKNEALTSRSFDCRGNFDLSDGHSFGCHKADGHGVISFGEAFINSCNCAYYLLGLEGGGAALIDMAQRFGMGKRLLNIDLWENSGNLPFRAEYSGAECLNLAIGQGEILITPLQCAVMAATIANGGVAHEVNIADEIKDSKGKVSSVRKKGSHRVISKENASVIADMMRGCVLYGTARAAADSPAMISGKTGSAESGWIYGDEALVHGWFCGFFPSDKPKYAMAILAEGAGSGAMSCVEPFAEIAEKIIAKNL